VRAPPAATGSASPSPPPRRSPRYSEIIDTEQLHTLVPLSATLGMRLSDAAPDGVRLEMTGARTSAPPAASSTAEC
jgi:hypothetical protein